MVRTHKSENQASVSGAGKEESGASKRKRKAQEEKNLECYRSGLAKFLRPVEKGSLEDQTDRPSTNSNPPGNASCQNEIFDAGDNETEQEIVAEILVSEAKVPDLLNLDNTDEHLNEKIENHEAMHDNQLQEESSMIQDYQDITGSVSDPSSWPKALPNSFIQAALSSKISEPLGASEDVTKFLKTWLTTTHKNREPHTRDWLRVSEDSAYCLPCCVYSKHRQSPWTNYSAKAYSDFRHAKRGVTTHEESLTHIMCVSQWKKYLRNLQATSSVSALLRKELQRSTSEWKQILRGILDCILYLAQQNLAFRGSSTDIRNPDCGNFLSLVSLLAKYYPPLAKHLDRISPGQTSYLSPQIQNEFIHRCGAKVRDQLLSQIRQRKYFAIMVDATPDISKEEQLSFVLRTVDCNNKTCQIKENFLGFITTTQKTGEGLCNVILEQLAEWKLDIANCRAQGYDNGANMAGRYNGVQAHITRMNPQAIFVPCAAHSLNLVGSNAAEKILAAKLLLGTIQNLYQFFASSPSKWKVLTAECKLTLKQHSQTRWCSKARAVSALWTQITDILDLLESFQPRNDSSDSDEEPEVAIFSAEICADAAARLHSISNFKFLLGLCIWNKLLQQINQCNEYLQKTNCDVNRATKKLDALTKWLEEFQRNGWKDAVEECTVLADKISVDVNSGFENVRRGRGFNPKYSDEGIAMKTLGPLEVLSLLHTNGLDSNYWNCCVALRLFLTSPVSVAANERSFSKLKLIKNYLRSTMSQERLTDISILSIERDTVKDVDMEEVIHEFATQQSRRISLE